MNSLGPARFADLAERGSARLGAMARDALDGEVDSTTHLAGRARFLRAIANPQPRRRQGGRVWASPWAGAVAVAAAVAALVLSRHREAPLDGRVEAGELTNEGPLEVPAAGPAATIEVSHGGAVTLAPGSRGSIARANTTHPHVTLHRGRASVSTSATVRLEWLIDAGPFAVTSAGGTEVSWHPDTRVLEVRASDGDAVVRGPLAESGTAVLAGHHLTVDVVKQSVRVESENSGSTHATSPLPPNGQVDGPRLLAPTVDVRVTWSRRVAAGEFGTVLDEARARGLDRTFARASLADLAALADAARYTGESSIARRALLAERSRFVGSSEAKTAAFLLGRLAEDSAHAPREASAWYDRYLAETGSTGPLAAEAMGRQMTVLAESSGHAAATPLAEEYLRRFPKGPYARAARDLVGGTR